MSENGRPADTVNRDRDLTTTRTQVFGDVEKGTECRVCGRNVTDGRSKACSDYCNNLLSAVMGMLNWSSVRQQIIERDDETCQECGYDNARHREARSRLRGRIEELCGPRPESPSLKRLGEGEVTDEEWDQHRRERKAWVECRDRMRDRYGDPYDIDTGLEVDHITPVADGGHPFDPGNLQTLCDKCHQKKTSKENSERSKRKTPSRGDMSESLFEFVADGGEAGE